MTVDLLMRWPDGRHADVLFSQPSVYHLLARTCTTSLDNSQTPPLVFNCSAPSSGHILPLGNSAPVHLVATRSLVKLRCPPPPPPPSSSQSLLPACSSSNTRPRRMCCFPVRADHICQSHSDRRVTMRAGLGSLPACCNPSTRQGKCLV